MLNTELSKDDFVDEISKKYKNAQDYNTGSVEVIAGPFKVLHFKHVLSDEKFLESLRDEASQLQFNRKSNDLYSLWQTADLNQTDTVGSAIQEFLNVLRSQVGPLLSRLMCVKFNDKISVTASLYKHGDVLLCHDDKCEDRCVAFVLYLTGTGSENGGEFQMYNRTHDGQPDHIVRTIPAVENSLVCFEVGNFTYHRVSEVKDDNFNRFSINGWFHSDRRTEPYEYLEPFPRLIQPEKLQDCLFLDDFISTAYSTPSFLKEARCRFETESQILLPKFFTKTFYESCESALKENAGIIWRKIGPPNRRTYETARIEEGLGKLSILINLLRSPLFISYLANITGLDFVNFDGMASTQLTLEVQKWKQGFYSMATDNDTFFTKSGLDLYFYFASPKRSTAQTGGFISYLAADDDDELLTVEPKDNALMLVYRTSDTIKFCKYVNSKFDGQFFCVAATYYESSELTS